MTAWGTPHFQWKENWRAGPSVIQHCRKKLHSRTKENRLDQIQKALWRKLEPLFSRNKKSFTLQKRSKNMRLHHRANPADQKTITTVNRYKCHDLSVWNMRLKPHLLSKMQNLPEHNLPSRLNNFIGISSILAWGKSRVGLPPNFIAMTAHLIRTGFSHYSNLNVWRFL